MNLDREDNLKLREKILSMNESERKRLGINKSTLWYIKKICLKAPSKNSKRCFPTLFLEISGMINNNTGLIEENTGLITETNEVEHTANGRRKRAGNEARAANPETFPYLQSKTCHSLETNHMKKSGNTFLKRRE